MSNLKKQEPSEQRNSNWDYENLRSVHLELSTLCNSICPWCPRYNNFSPNLNPNIQEGYYTLEQFKEHFPVDFIQQIKFWTFAGDYGDPGTCPHIIPILDHINKTTIQSPTIQINTNGGMKGTQFWYQLGLSTNSNSYVIFSVDGLEDTNHIYRRNVQWKKVWANMKSYSATGAKGIWEFLKFKHNEHQMDKAKELADELGFEIRFKNPNGFEGGPMPVRDKQYNVQYEIYPCDDNPIKPIPQKAVEFIEALDLGKVDDKVCDTIYKDRTTEIVCSANHKFGAGNEIRINQDGTVWPCSFFGHTHEKYLENRLVGKPHQRQMRRVFKDINNNLNDRTLKEILDDDPFREVYEGWPEHKMMVCSDSCGHKPTMEKIYGK